MQDTLEKKEEGEMRVIWISGTMAIVMHRSVWLVRAMEEVLELAVSETPEVEEAPYCQWE